MRRLFAVVGASLALAGGAYAAYPKTKPILGTLCAAKYKGKVTRATNGRVVKCSPVTMYRWKLR